MTEHLKWRYATKRFDHTKRISDTEMKEILESLRLAPSSFGLQPWKFVVIKDEELKKRLRPHAWNQSQITDASHIVVLCILKQMTEDYVRGFVRDMAHVRGVAVEALLSYEKIVIDFLNAMTPLEATEWMEKQVYLALGMLLSECAHRRIDACPIEGFEPKKFDEVLELEREGLESVVVCAVGYRAADDKYAHLQKVRYDASQVFIYK